MPNAIVSPTSNSLTSGVQGISVSQDIDVRQSAESMRNRGTASPTVAFKMRAWDTVEDEYVYWMSYGDQLTGPPTLNPVINVTAIRVSLMRTV